MRKIFVVNDSGHDFGPAKTFADKFIVLSSGKINIFATDRIKSDFEEKLQEAEEGDMLLLSGNSILNVLASIIMMSKVDEVSFLIYNFNTAAYERRKYGLRDFSLQTKITEELQ